MNQRATDQKVPVVTRRDYTIFIEYIPTQPDRSHWLHIDVHRWSASVARAISQDFDTLLDLNGGPFHVLVDLYNGKLMKFIAMFGFEEIGRVRTNDGTIKRQFVAHPGRKLRLDINSG